MPTESEDSPRRFGRYEVVRRIARGGMGEVYLGQVQGAGGWERRVAIKTVLPHLTDQADSIARFVDEARIATSLTHGNIVSVFDLDRNEDGTWFIAMEFVDGWDLRWLIKQAHDDGRHLSEPIAIYLVAELCRGLSYAHTRRDANDRPLNIVHRDISPANILVSRDGEVKITDFGIAAARNRLGKTITGELRGKFGYMSPEQAAGAQVDARSDIFSTGILLFELLSGVKPFNGANDMETLARVQRGERADLAQISPVGDDLVAIVDKALALQAEDRFQSAEEMQLALLQLLYRDTIPVTDRQVSDYFASLENHGTSGGGSPGFDTLLRMQLEELHQEEGTQPRNTDTATGPRERTPFGSQGSDNARRYVSGGYTGPHSGVNSGTVNNGAVNNSEVNSGAASNGTVTVQHDNNAPRRSVWRWLVPVLVVFLVPTIVAVAYLTGRQGSILPTTVRVETKPTGARVFIDGSPFGMTTLVERVKPGVHFVRLTMDGYETLERTVTFEANRTNRLGVVLAELEAAESPTDRRLDAASEGITSQNPSPSDDPEANAQDAANDTGNATENATTDPSAAGEPSSRTAEDAAHSADVDVGEFTVANRPTPAVISRTFLGVPNGATVTVNGRSVDAAAAIRLNAATALDIAVTSPNHRPFVARWARADAAPQPIPVQLEPVARGTITVRFVGDILRGTVFVDGERVGSNSGGTRLEIPVASGSHDLRVINEATGHEFVTRLNVEADRSVIVPVNWRLE